MSLFSCDKFWETKTFWRKLTGNVFERTEGLACHASFKKISWNDPVLAKDFFFTFLSWAYVSSFLRKNEPERIISLFFLYYIFDSVSPSLRWLDNHKYAAVGKVVRHSEEHLVLNKIWLKKFVPLHNVGIIRFHQQTL